MEKDPKVEPPAHCSSIVAVWKIFEEKMKETERRDLCIKYAPTGLTEVQWELFSSLGE